MKIRSGFVSNSSTSSFILIGQYFPDVDATEIMKKYFPKVYDKAVAECSEDKDLYLEDVLQEAMYDMNATEADGLDIVSDDSGAYIGITLAEWSDDGDSLDMDLDFSELAEMQEKVKEHGLTPKLIGGIRPC